MPDRSLQNPHGVSPEMLKRLSAELRPLTDFQAGIAEELLEYVVDGTSETSVLKLAGFNSAASALGLSSTGNWGDRNVKLRLKDRALLLRPENDATIPAEFWLRLAQVYAAARKTETGVPTRIDYWPAELEFFFREILAASVLDVRPRPTGPIGRGWQWTCAELISIWEEADSCTDAFITGILEPISKNSILQGMMLLSSTSRSIADIVSGIPELLSQNSQLVATLMQKADTKRRIDLINCLEEYQFDFANIVDVVAELAVSKAKTVRETGAQLLSPIGEAARGPLETLLQNGDAGQRNESASALSRLFGDTVHKTLKAHAENEKSKRVIQTIERIVASDSSETEAVSSGQGGDWPPVVAPVNIPIGEVELTPIGRDGVRTYLENCHAKALSEYQRAVERYDRPDRPDWLPKPREPRPFGDEQFAEVVQFLEGKTKSLPNRGYWRELCHYGTPGGPWFKPPHFELVHSLRFQYAMGLCEAGRGGQALSWHDTQALETYRSNCEQPFGLREVDTALTTLPRFEPGDALRGYIANNTDWASFCDWEAEAIWPAFVDQLEMLQGYFGPSPNRGSNYRNFDYSWGHKRRTAFRVLGLFPQVPPSFIPMLWELALGESKTDRPLAQAALSSSEGRVPRAIAALSDGKQAIRAAAADWLAELEDTTAIEPLKKAFIKEKQEIVKASLMQALERLGADVSEFLDRDTLQKEAEKGLKKQPPKGMEWVPLSGFPDLTWEDNGKPVSAEVIQWWIIQSVKQKSPACNPLMRRYLSLCRADESAEFALFVLSTWIAYDSETVTHEKALEDATQSAKQLWSVVATYYTDLSKLVQEIYQTKINECLNSGIGQKGLLSIAAAAGDRRCVTLAEQYIRRWYGQRAAQCKALLEVLSWIEDPQAIQVLLSIANRFRTKSIQKAAHDYVQELADRQGWTVEQLADRTIPDGGFQREQDDDGLPIGEVAKMVVDYGPRTFEIQLDDDLKPVITKNDGKTVKNLPAAAKDDDEESVKAAKKAFSAAKKTVKEVVKRQTERLYEAMCTGRRWPIADWQRYLAWHPIVGKLCCRMVWNVQAADETMTSFRPLEDGTYTDVDDNSIELPPEGEISVAHTCGLSSEIANAWRTHLEDYDVSSLFPQFREQVYVLSDEKKNARSLDDFEGHMTTSFKLRSAANKLGYQRGDIEDGAAFISYHKRFLSLEVQAVISFTGSYLPEDDIAVALMELTFAAYRPDSAGSDQTIPLQKIPAVLLSECYNDIKQIADSGGGYDKEWQNKSFM